MQTFSSLRVALAVVGLSVGASVAHAGPIMTVTDTETGPDYVSSRGSYSYTHDVGSLSGFDVIGATLKIWLSDSGLDGAEYALFKMNGNDWVIDAGEVDGATCASTTYCASWHAFGPYVVPSDILADIALTGMLSVKVKSTGGDFWFKKSRLTVDYRTREVPEPAALTLLGVGLIGMGILRRRQRRG